MVKYKKLSNPTFRKYVDTSCYYSFYVYFTIYKRSERAK